MFTCSQTVPYRYLIVILVKVASCSCVHSFVDACSEVGKWYIQFGMGMFRFGMEHLSGLERNSRVTSCGGALGAADWCAARACFG